MPIQPQVPLGSTVEADCFFFKDDGKTPLATVGGVIFNVFAPNNLKVLSGIAAQDFTNPAHWVASIAIPLNAPITNAGQFYTLQWIANTNQGRDRQTQQFTVAAGSSPDPIDASVVTLQNMPFEVDLVLPYSSVSSLSMRIVDSYENVIVQMSTLNITPVTRNGTEFIYQIPVDDTAVLGAMAITNNTGLPNQTPQAPNIIVFKRPTAGYNYGNSGPGLMGYIAYINYTDPNGIKNTEIQPIYICSTLMLQLMKGVQNFIDILRNNDTIPQLRVSESKLVYFLIQGLLKFNAAIPQQIQFSFANLPQQFQMFVQKFACLEFLQALYLGEGMTSFNFGGMSVNLDSDRTQYIATMMDGLRNELVDVVVAKKNFAKSGGGTGMMGSIGTTFGPNFNFVFSAAGFIGSGINGTGVGNGFALPFLY